MRLTLDRPLAFLDLETTGTDPEADRIVEIAILRLETDGARSLDNWLVNPGCPIPARASAIHGITDETVRDRPQFKEIAPAVLVKLEGADLAGYNIRRFDALLLHRELWRIGLADELGIFETPPKRRILDAMTIFHRKEPRDLAAALRLYSGREHEGAHGAAADVIAAFEVFEGELARYEDLPAHVDALADWCAGDDADLAGKFSWDQDGDLVISFGKHRGQKVRDVPGDYLDWIVRSADLPADAAILARSARHGRIPKKATA